MDREVPFDLYAWKSPRDLDADGAEALLTSWEEAGGDPATSPFEPSDDVGWIYRELLDVPGLDMASDAVPNVSATPIWLGTAEQPPARIVAIRLSREDPDNALDALEEIVGLATKYDLVLFDTRNRRIHLPHDEMAAYASATFWPAGAIQAAVAGGIGGLIAAVAWFLGIPILSGVLIVIGGFMAVMAVFTFIHEGRQTLRARRTGRTPPPND